MSEKQKFIEVEVIRNSKRLDDGCVLETVEKLKVRRPCVKITEREAEVLNNGRMDDAGNRIFSLFVKDEKELEKISLTRKNSKA